MRTRFTLLFFCSITFSTLFCQKPLILSNQQIQLLDSIATKDVPVGAPGIATGIVSNGEIIYENVEGYANLKDSSFINGASRFNIASNGKQFTALAILLLVEEGKLSMEDDLRKFFPALYPDIEKPIKIKHLLNHSSGIRDVYNLWSLKGLTWWKHTFDNQDAISLLQQQKELNFESGSQHSYSNSNYILLAEIVGKVTGTSFVEYTNQLFQSLNMPNTSFVSDYKKIKEPIANPYFNFNTWSSYNWICNLHGDGNLFSTLKDQLEWEKIIQTKESNILSKALITKSQSLIVGTEIDNYGYGVEFAEHKGFEYAFHAGATGAWKAITTRFTAHNFSIITLTNSGKVDPMGQTLQMADVLLGIDAKKQTFLTAPEQVGDSVSIQDVLGTYQTTNGYMMRFVEREGDLYLLRSGRNDMKLVRESANIFHQWNDAPFKQEFTKNEKGEMQITAYYITVAPFTLTRIESDWAGMDYEALNGQFVNKETDVTFNLNYQTGKNYEVKVGKKKRKAYLISPSELMVQDYRLKFTKDNQGKITELFLTSGRIQEVRFSRIIK